MSGLCIASDPIVLTPMAVTKLAWRLRKPKILETAFEQPNETRVMTMKMAGMIAKSISLSAVSCDASFVKTVVSLADCLS